MIFFIKERVESTFRSIEGWGKLCNPKFLQPCPKFFWDLLLLHHHLDEWKLSVIFYLFKCSVKAFTGVTEISFPSPEFCNLRVRPIYKLVKSCRGVEKLLHPPSPIIENDENRVNFESYAVAYLLSRHLETSITEKDQWTCTCDDCITNRCRSSKSHRSVVGCRHYHGCLDSCGDKETVPSIWDNRHLTEFAEEPVDSIDDLFHTD